MRENHVSLDAECLWVWGGSEFSVELVPFLANRAEGVLQGVRPSGGGQYRSGARRGPSDPLNGFKERFRGSATVPWQLDWIGLVSPLAFEDVRRSRGPAGVCAETARSQVQPALVAGL